jgi:protein phosphatase
VEAETAVRRDLAAFLVAHLTSDPDGSGEDTAMLELRHCAHSDTGRVRPANQDTAYAGTRLLAVEALRFLDTEEIPAGGVLTLLEDAIRGAEQAVFRRTDQGANRLLWRSGRAASRSRTRSPGSTLDRPSEHSG